MTPVFQTIRRQEWGFTLIEVMLSLALTSVVVGLLTLAVQVNLRTNEASRRGLTEARVARRILGQIADDIRNALPFKANASSSTSSSSDAAAAGGVTAPADAAATPTASSGSTSSSTLPTSGGVFGCATEIQIETSRRAKVPTNLDPNSTTSVGCLSDIRIVNFSLGQPSAVSMSDQGASSPSGTGLYRREVDRAAFANATQQGDTDTLAQSTQCLAANVVSIQFSYYDGESSYDEWDSNEQGKLPSAVQVTISVARGSPDNVPTDAAAAEDIPKTNYGMLIELPNAGTGGSSSTTTITSGGGG